MKNALWRTLACAAACTGASTLAATYEVKVVPAEPLTKFGTHGVRPTAMDHTGQTLLDVTAQLDDGRVVHRGQNCDGGATVCSLLKPRQVDNVWTAVSSDITFIVGHTLAAPGVAGWAMRRGPKFEYLFYGGESRSVNRKGTVVGTSADGQVAWAFGKKRHDLPGLPGGYSAANAINDAGLIVGESRSARGEKRAVAWRNGRLELLQAGIPDGQGYEASAKSLSAAGTAFGSSNFPMPGKRKHAVRFTNGQAVDLGTLSSPSDNDSEVLAVNHFGVAVGYSTNHPASDEPQAVIFDGNDTATELATLIPDQDRAKYHLQYAVNVSYFGDILVAARRRDTNESVALRLDKPWPQDR